MDLLWEEFKLPIWVTEFDWNADSSVDFGDHSYHAEQIEKFYRLMFSHEVSITSYIFKNIPIAHNDIYKQIFLGSKWHFDVVIEYFGRVYGFTQQSW